MGEPEKPEAKAESLDTKTKTPDQTPQTESSHLDVASMLLSKAKDASESVDHALELTEKDIGSWTLRLSEKLQAIFGAEYSKEYLFVVLTEIKNQTTPGKNLFDGMSEKIKAEGSVKFSFSKAACDAIRSEAREKKADQKLITQDWKLYLVKDGLEKVAPQEKPKDPIPPVVVEKPQEPAQVVTVTPPAPEAKMPEKPQEEKLEDIVGKAFCKIIADSLKPGQAFGGLVESNIPGFDFKFDTDGVYLYKTPAGETRINGLTIDQYIQQGKKTPKFSEEDLKAQGVTEQISFDEFAKKFGTVDKEKISKLKALDEKYKDKNRDPAYFAELQGIIDNTPNSLPVSSVNVPLKIGDNTVDYIMLILKTDNGYRVVTFIEQASLIRFPLLNKENKPYPPLQPNLEAHIVSDIENVVFPDLKSLGEKVLSLSQYAS